MTPVEIPQNKALDPMPQAAMALECRRVHARTRRGVLVAQQLSTKARLGAVAQTFDPDAVDGDGDGLVQDGSPFERPAVIKAVASAAQRAASILSKAARTQKSRSREYQRRHSGMSAADIAKDAVPNSFEAWAGLIYERMMIGNPDLPRLSADMTPAQRADIARRLEDFIESDLVWMLSIEKADEFKKLKKTDRVAAFRMLVENAFDFDPKKVAKNRALVEHVLTTNPEFRALVDKHGMPPITMYGGDMDPSHMASGFYASAVGMSLDKYGRVKSQGRIDNLSRGLKKWFMTSIIDNEVGSGRTDRWTTSNSPESLLIHEYGHYIADMLKQTMTWDDERERTARWQAFRFAAGANWKETFKEMGHPEWYEKYTINRKESVAGVRGLTLSKFQDVPDEIPHVATAYGESSPGEAFAEAIAAIFGHGGRNADLVSPGMRELINDALELPSGKDPRESILPPRVRREIVPDGFASRGATMVINAERDSRLGDIDDPYELTAAVTGTLDGDDRVGKMVRKLQDLKDDPKRWDRMSPEWRDEIDVALNVRKATTEEAALILRNIIENPAFAEMLRRHGSANIYFSQTDLRLAGDKDVRGVLFGGFTPDGSVDDKWWPPRVIIDMIGGDERGAPDSPMEATSAAEIAKYTGKAPVSVNRTHVSRSDMHVVRHEVGHSIHDQLWERVHRGEITGVRARLIEAYAKSDWNQFYAVLGRADLWREHQRALANPWPPPSAEIGQVDAAYAWFTPREMFAEAFTAYTSSNPEFRALLNDTMIEQMQMMLGDAEARVSTEKPPALPGEADIDADIPQPPPWDGFASKGPDGTSPKSYSDFRTGRMKKGKGEFSRREMFRNTTTDQKIDLAVPTDRRDYKLMLWDAYFEKMGLRYEEYRKIDLSDPDNPKPPRRWGSEFADNLLEASRTLDTGMPDFDPATVDANRQALRATLDAFPRMREIAERFGIPPVTTMSRDYQDRAAREFIINNLLGEVVSGRKQMSGPQIQALFDAAEIGFDTIGGLDDPRFGFLRDAIDGLEQDGTMDKIRNNLAGGYSTMTRGINVARDGLNSFIDGKRYDHSFVPEKGDYLVGGPSYEATLLHEFAHHVDLLSLERDEMLASAGDEDALERMGGREEALNEATRAEHIATTYGQSNEREFFAELIAAVLSGSRDQEAMLSPEASKLARSIAGLPERDPVFAGRTPGMPPSADEMLTDRFGELWIRTRENMLKPVNEASARRSRDGVPDVLETMIDAKLRTGLAAFDDVSFEHKGRKFMLRQEGDTFSVDIDGRTVATASVVEGRDGLPEITNVDVSPGYEGIAPDKDLHEMVVDHARTAYPSARAPMRARRTQIETDGFASIGTDHHDARQIDGTPGTPEYARAAAAEFEAAKASGKKVFFDYNGETREVEVTEVFEKNGLWYMKGNDALRNSEERMFRLDRVSMPKRVQNPETGADEIAMKPGKPPRKPVQVFTGKAAEIFEGAESWEEVAARLGKGRFVFVDFETTGIEESEFKEMMHPGSPAQIGLVEIIDGKVTRRWSTHVNPGRPMWKDPETGRVWSAENLKYKDPVTGELIPVTDEWLAQQKSLKDALEEMLEWMGPLDDLVLGGQNTPYDDGVMRQAMIDAGLDPARWNPAGFIDSQALAQSLLDKNSDDHPVDPKKGYKTVSLGPLATWLGHDMGDGWHSADADSEASWEAFSRLVRRAADHENSGKPVRRDLFAPGGGAKEYQERLDKYERQKRGWDYKVKKYKEAQASRPPETPAEGFASRGPTGEPRVRARNPKSWDQMTSLEREEATRQSAENAIKILDKLADQGFGPEDIRNLTREELVAFLADQFPEGDVVLSDATALGGGHLIEVANATMGKVFMAMGFHVTVRDDDPTQVKILENGINDMQTALREYVDAIKKKPDELLKTGVFKQWAESQKKADGTPAFDLTTKKGLKKAAKDFRDRFEIDMCLYYKADINLLCGENIGIEREEMPQLSGRMTGDDSFAARAVRAGLVKFSKLKIDEDKLSKLDEATQKRIRDLLAPTEANKNGKLTNQIIADIAKNPDHPDHDLVTKQLWGVVNWNDSEADAGSLQDAAAQALGITVEEARFVDPATMLGAQNQLQGSKLENMADGATSTILETILTENGQAIPVLDESIMTDEWVAHRFELEVDDKKGIAKAREKIAELRSIAADPAKYKATDNEVLQDMAKIIDLDAAAKWVKANPATVTEQMMDRYHDYLANVRKNGLFGATLTAGQPGSQIYMLDGHHRWSGLLMANQKLADLGLDVRVKLNIKNYQTDIRSGLELGKALQNAFGLKDAKVKGEDLYVEGDFPAMTQAEFDKVIADLKSKDFLEKAVDKIRKDKESPFQREDTPGDKSGAVKPRKRPIQDVADEIAGRPITLEPKSRVEGVKARSTGYRAVDSGSMGGWNSVEDHIAIETERGNKLFKGHKEYVDKGFEAAWVTHEPGDAGRYVVSAGDIDAWEAGEVEVDPANIEEVDLAGATLVGTDDEGGFLYVRKKPTERSRRRIAELRAEEEMLDGFASTGGWAPVTDETLPDGSRVQTFPNGRKRTTSPDGRMVRDEWPDDREPRKPGDRPGSFGFGTSTPPEGEDWLDEEDADRDEYRSGVNRDGFASLGGEQPPPWDGSAPTLLPDLGSRKRGGKAQRDRDIVPDDYHTQPPKTLAERYGGGRNAGARVPEGERDEIGGPIPGAPIYRESMRIGRKKYTFEVDAEGNVSVYTGRKYKQVAQLTLDRGHTRIGGRKPQRDRHHISMVSVEERHRRKGIATEMLKVAEHVYGGRVEHSSVLTDKGRKFRDADMGRRGTPGAEVGADGFASRGSTGDAFDPGPDSPLDRAADRLKLGRGAGTDSDLPDAVMLRFGTMVTPKDQQTLAQRLGLTWEQIKEQWERNAGEINQLVDRFVADPEVREWTKYGLKLIGIASSYAGATRGMAELIGKLEFSIGSAEGSGVGDVFDMITHFIEGGLGDALATYGIHYANLIATEFAAMRLVTRQRAKKMIDDIRARMEGAGQKIGEISADMWARLRGAWAKTRPLAPVAAIGMKEWIIAGPGMTPAWARMSWDGYQSKSRITQRLMPSDPGRWGEIATRIGPSPELIDIATYRAGIGYGARRIKPLDVVRVYA